MYIPGRENLIPLGSGTCLSDYRAGLCVYSVTSGVKSSQGPGQSRQRAWNICYAPKNNNEVNASGARTEVKKKKKICGCTEAPRWGAQNCAIFVSVLFVFHLDVSVLF